MRSAAGRFQMPLPAARKVDWSSRRSGFRTLAYGPVEKDDLDPGADQAGLDRRHAGEVDDPVAAAGQTDGAFDRDLGQAAVDRGVV